MEHRYALRTPWYVRLRGKIDIVGREARRPAIQKYAVPDFVEQLLVPDPRKSLTFDDAGEDVWSYPVPLGFPGPGRLRFATHQMVTTGVRKLYQPNHDRFYAVTIELFCDEPGLPRPGPVEGLEVGFVVRRERLAFTGKGADAVKAQQAELRKLARDLVVELHKEQGRPEKAPEVPVTDDVERVASAQWAVEYPFSEAQAKLLDEITDHVVEGWTVDDTGRGTWTPVPQHPSGEPPVLLSREQELPMWRLPPREKDCPAGRTRSLWFGLVPTFSGDVDTLGRPKLDDESTYRIVCFARQQPGPGREPCPPTYSWSEGTRPYRLASFFDPAGTKNRRFTITMPDFRALGARAGQQQGPGGVEIVRPPGSQLKFEPPGTGSLPPTPKQVGGQIDLGADTSRCTFALELLMIVAMFLFSLFLPIVVLLFQLWWLLLLKFCWPPNAAAMQILTAHLNAGGTIAGMDPGEGEEREALDEIVEADGAADGLAAVPTLSAENETAKALVASAQPPDPVPPPVVPAVEIAHDDPLCEPGGRP